MGAPYNTPWDAAFYDHGAAVFNVKNKAYGATGDGSTDDTTAIQAAITDAAAVNGFVFFPSSATAYRTQVLTLTAGVRGIIGAGYPILQPYAAGAKLFDASGVDDVLLRGMTFKGHSGGAETSANQLTTFTNSTNIRVEDCVYQNGWHRPLYFLGVVGFRVVGCRFLSCSNGPYFEGSSDGLIQGNRIKDSQQADGTFKVGLALMGYNATYGLNTNVTVANNRVSGMKNGQAYLAHGGADLAFLGNRGWDTTNGMTFSAASANDTQTDLLVEGNTLVGTGAVAYTVTYDMGISVNGTQAANDGTVIRSNVIKDYNLDAQNVDWGGISCLGALNMLCSGNSIRDGWGNGIVFSGASSTDAHMMDNKITDITGSGAIAGVKIDTGCTVTGKFQRNHITGCTNAYRFDGTTTGLVVESDTEADNTAVSNGAANCVFNGRLQPADADTTPSVLGRVRVVIFNNTGATTVTDFDDGEVGQVIVMRCSNGNTTLSENSDGGGNFRLDTDLNFTFASTDTLTVIYTGSTWLEVSRSTN